MEHIEPYIHDYGYGALVSQQDRGKKRRAYATQPEEGPHAEVIVTAGGTKEPIDDVTLHWQLFCWPLGLAIAAEYAQPWASCHSSRSTRSRRPLWYARSPLLMCRIHLRKVLNNSSWFQGGCSYLARGRSSRLHTRQSRRQNSIRPRGTHTATRTNTKNTFASQDSLWRKYHHCGL